MFLIWDRSTEISVMAKKKKWTHTQNLHTQDYRKQHLIPSENCNTLLTNDHETGPLGESLAKAFQLLTFEEMIYVETVEVVPTSCHLSSSRCGCHGDVALPPTSPFKESRILRVRSTGWREDQVLWCCLFQGWNYFKDAFEYGERCRCHMSSKNQR